MNSIRSQRLTELLANQTPPCLSLYQPTHRRYPENRQDPIRFCNLVKELEASLVEKYRAAEVTQLLEPFAALVHNDAFWSHTLDGLAVLGSQSMFRALRLPQPFSQLAVVGDSFHTKPLRGFLQSVDRYQVLGLSLHRVRIFEGNRHALDEVALVAEVQQALEEAWADPTKPSQVVGSHARVASPSTHPDHDGKQDGAAGEWQRFFRAIDSAVLVHYSRPSGLPLILAALPQHYHLFHQVSQNPFLLEDGIRFNPDSLSTAELRGLAWHAVEPRYRAKLALLREEFEQARAGGLGSDDLAQVARAAAAGQVATLLIESDRQIAGWLDDATGRIEFANLNHPRDDDLLDKLGVLVAKRHGSVLVIGAEWMPSSTGLAATYRY